MLKQLDVKNFALIDDLEINFKEGLTALTGETGSGKSILLESLSLLFGKRSDAEFIRFGSKKAIVRGTFEIPLRLSKALDIPNVFDLTREIDESGRHLIKLNQDSITLSKLRNITSKIGLIHAQNDTFLLMDKDAYIEFIDQIDKDHMDKLMESYLLKRSIYIEKLKHLESIKHKRKETEERMEFLKIQVQELSSYQLKENEKETLEEAVDKLKNFDHIKQSLELSNQIFKSEIFQVDELYQVVKALEKIKSYDKTYEDVYHILEESYYNLEDASKTLSRALDDLDFDSQTFNQYQERLFELSKIEIKYGKTTNELIRYLNELNEELALSSDYEGYMKSSQEALKKAYDEAFEIGFKIHEKRFKLKTTFEKEILDKLKHLDLDKSKFEIQFEPVKNGQDLYENGLDQVEFMISLNEGEPLKPLAKVASGGEKARFMFALKTIFATKSDLSLVVFDEIDIGISGKTATKMANQMVELSKNIQTLVITHLPQVAAKANYHYQIYKEKIHDRMQTMIKVLTDEERILSIASMLSDDEVSHYAIEQAKALLHK